MYELIYDARVFNQLERIMGFRFQKRVRIMKGLTVNLSKTGASLTLGGRGASVNLSKHGTKMTVGLPGTGLSYSKLHKQSQPIEVRPDEMLNPPKEIPWLLIFLVVALLVGIGFVIRQTAN